MEIKTTHQVSECFYNGTWKSPVGQSDPFVPALASMASYPAATNAADDGRMMGQPVQRFNLSMFGSQIRPNFGNHPSSAQFPADPGFERMVTSFSCFSGLKGKLELPSRNTSVAAQDGNLGSEKRKSGLWRSDTAEKAELVDSEKESSVSEQAHLPAGNSAENSNSRKRKSFSRGKAKEHPSLSADEAKEAEGNDESGEKRSKQDEVAEKRTGANGRDNESQKQSKENSKPTEPPKDYIHVRARRGEATDSHSLAERVRREKISERMKLLQDLVPGCNKVTGKAVMLDEIINYVQSLQRQVEFLSMKLATVNPGMDFSMDSLLSKDMNQIFQTQGSLPHGCHPLDSSMPVFPFGGHVPQDLSGLANNVGVQFLMNQANGAADRSPGMHLHPVAEFGNSITQVPSVWEDDLQSIVQMGFTQNQPESFQRSTAAGKLKIEL